MMKSMAQGKPLKLILQFAFPLLIGNLLQQTYNIIDAAIFGKALGSGALAGGGVCLYLISACLYCLKKADAAYKTGKPIFPAFLFSI